MPKGLDRSSSSSLSWPLRAAARKGVRIWRADRLSASSNWRVSRVSLRAQGTDQSSCSTNKRQNFSRRLSDAVRKLLVEGNEVIEVHVEDILLRQEVGAQLVSARTRI